MGRFTLAQVWARPNSDMVIAVALVGLISFLCAIREFQIVWRTDDKLRNWRFGMRGEEAVGEKLVIREVAAAGYVAFHDVPGRGPKLKKALMIQTTGRCSPVADASVRIR